MLLVEGSHRGLVRWFAKPVKVSKPFGGSNPPPSAKSMYKLVRGKPVNPAPEEPNI